jgi:DNA-directed RNA polymerase
MMAKKEKPIMWTTPTGFRVVQDYRKPEFKRLVTKSYSVRYYLPVNGTRPVNKSKQELGIIANFVHSMDAAHLIKVVNALEAAGVKDIAVVHDSYGVHAQNVPLMNKLIRQQFLEIYKQPVLEQFIDEQIDRTGIDLPSFEKYGELDIDKVLESEYFFS